MNGVAFAQHKCHKTACEFQIKIVFNVQVTKFLTENFVNSFRISNDTVEP